MSRVLLPSQVIPGATIRGLVLVCKACNKQVPVHEHKNGFCIECQATALCKELRAELVRLYHKRDRYLQKKIAVKHNDEQAERTRIRILKAVQKLTTDPERVSAIVNAQGQLAREAALTHSRIHLPVFGSRR